MNIMKNLNKIISLLSLVLFFVGFSNLAIAQDENDDLYFSKKDRKSHKAVTAPETTDAGATYTAYASTNSYANATYSAKEVNPEYIEKYKALARQSAAEARGETNDTTVIAAEKSNYNTTDYFVEGEVAEYDNPSFYNDPKYSRNVQSNQPSNLTNNYYGGYGGGYNNYGSSTNVGYNSAFGWTMGLSYVFGSGGYGNNYYDPFAPSYGCPTYGYNNYRWDPYYGYSNYNYGYNQGYAHGYSNGYYNGGYNSGYYNGGYDPNSNYTTNSKSVIRGGRYSHNSSKSDHLVRLSSVTPQRSMSRNTSRSSTSANSSGRASTSSSARVSRSTTTRAAAVTAVNHNQGSQNEYLRRANVSTSRTRLTNASNRVSSRSTANAYRSNQNNTATRSQMNNAVRTTNYTYGANRSGSNTRSSTRSNATRSSQNNVRRYTSSPSYNTSYGSSNNRSTSSYGGNRSNSHSSPSRSSSSNMRSSSPSRSSSSPSRSSGSRSSSSSHRGSR